MAPNRAIFDPFMGSGNETARIWVEGQGYGLKIIERRDRAGGEFQSVTSVESPQQLADDHRRSNQPNKGHPYCP
ncbi:MAG: hypothetical protein ABSG53_18305 [Thermoguttaceae bacterium]